MRSKEEFVKRFKVIQAGWGLYGQYTETKLGPMERAMHALNIPDEAERMLAMFYDWLAAPDPNGKPLGDVVSVRKS